MHLKLNRERLELKLNGLNTSTPYDFCNLMGKKTTFKAKILISRWKMYEFLRKSSSFFQCIIRCSYMAFLPFKNFWRKSYLTEVLNFLPKPIFYVLIKKFLLKKLSVCEVFLVQHLKFSPPNPKFIFASHLINEEITIVT